MPTFTIHDAKTNLSKLVARAEAGEEIVLARGKDPVVRLTPVTTPAKPQRKFGALKGKIKIGPEFFEPLPEKELKHWK
ncbi:MAG TPA: type II toxin-antitoxin system prevent-host-death family antitoxin [Reyranella sp.]|nr:type II toxin-antitoxin system prevent-host-death family antitoxin [Reyranella sp.]